ncbi:MAG: hypothetical protein EA361_02275 [Bacteroidetes bacterium]|nr:MAG: hypothetical protein EA361_02275 [Bacteroidota bacterium]
MDTAQKKQILIRHIDSLPEPELDRLFQSFIKTFENEQQPYVINSEIKAALDEALSNSIKGNVISSEEAARLTKEKYSFLFNR